ncbi:alpha/beta hydrolase [Polaribacter pacificus]|uniref:Alpha/beta hydrolase n=1 Tax=Polaribacter pacificus TaxID=1775173 RepID=A0A917I0J4_9FLAO|nr:alpha/beta hydrolase [Polaribacter pacificus]GGG99785.1 alpha/beta hydrolase [Polaribacter pacificus]
MTKTAIYFVPGMAANSKIFEHLSLDKERFDCHFLEWKIPTSKNEPLAEYAQRMCDEITHENPVLVGVSFGGVLVQEMSKLITTKKIIIISSIKSNNELPNRLKLIDKTKVYKLFPAKFIENLETYIDFFLGDYKQKKVAAYKKFLSVRDVTYLHWAIDALLHWQQRKPLTNTVHIHGSKDEVFPIKHIVDCHTIENGTHAMVLTKAKKITSIIEQAIT